MTIHWTDPSTPIKGFTGTGDDLRNENDWTFSLTTRRWVEEQRQKPVSNEIGRVTYETPVFTRFYEIPVLTLQCKEGDTVSGSEGRREEASRVFVHVLPCTLRKV